MALVVMSAAVEAKKKVLTIGDSTMANYDEVTNSGQNELRGWAQMLQLFFDGDVEVDNAAKNGRSSKSFYYEFWLKLRNTLKPGDYVIIQFGHNDEKNNGEDTDPNDTKGRGTAPWGQYREYLTRYVKESRERGAIPVLVTPIVRRMFNADGKSLNAQGKHNLKNLLKSDNDTLYDYVLAMKTVARELNVPLVDMTTSTEKKVIELGSEESKKIIYCNRDNTHLKALGALMYADLFAHDLKRQGILSSNLSFPKGLVATPANMDFKPVMVGQSAVKVLSVSGLGLINQQNIHLSVDMPYEVSLSPNADFSKAVDFTVPKGNFYTPVYVRFSPTKKNAIKEHLAVIVDNKPLQDIQLTGSGITIKKDKMFIAQYSYSRGCLKSNQASLESELKQLKYVVDKNVTSITLTDNEWPTGEIDVNSNRYFELALQAKKNILITQIGYTLNSVSTNKMQFTAQGSIDQSFSNPDTYSLMETMLPFAKQYDQNVSIQLKKGQTYYFRIYPWNKEGGIDKFFRIYNASFKGYELK